MRLASPVRVAVLASGGGSNLQALLDRFPASPDAPARVALVVASRAGVGALERAARAGVASCVLDAREVGAAGLEAGLLEVLAAHRIDLAVLAGYLQLVPAAVVRRYAGRMLNIHPALLPAFGGQGMYGIRVHRAVLESGARVSGATVHLVDEAYDRGRILAQWPVPVLEGDTPEALAARVLAVEHRLLPLVVERLAGGGAGEGEAPPAGPLAFELAAGGLPADTSLRLLISPIAPATDGR